MEWSCDKISINVDGYNKSRGSPKKIQMDCVNDDMSTKGVIAEMTADRELCRKNTFCVDPA